MSHIARSAVVIGSCAAALAAAASPAGAAWTAPQELPNTAGGAAPAVGPNTPRVRVTQLTG